MTAVTSAFGFLNDFNIGLFSVLQDQIPKFCGLAEGGINATGDSHHAGDSKEKRFPV